MGVISARLTAREDGFTLIELMVAVAVLAVGILGLVGSFDGSRNLNTVSERTELMTHVGQRYIERLHDTPYEGLMLTSAPTPNPTDPTHPDRFVCTGGTYSWNASGCSSTTTGPPPSPAPLIVKSGTAPTPPGIPPSTSWFDARSGARGTVHTYITWVDETCPDSAGVDRCPSTQDFKRLTVAVRLANGRPRTPVVVTSYAHDSDRERLCNPQDPAGGSTNCG